MLELRRGTICQTPTPGCVGHEKGPDLIGLTVFPVMRVSVDEFFSNLA